MLSNHLGKTDPEEPKREPVSPDIYRDMPEEDAADAAQGDGAGWLKELYDWAEALVLALVFVSLLFTFILRPVVVDGDSMYPTLKDKDRIIISNIFYNNPKHGDIVVITQPNFTNKPIIKRVIATEGQTVDIDYETGQVIVDGKALSETYIAEPISTQPYDPVELPLTVPKGEVFVMGDNRNHSTDSRSELIGTVDNRYIIGHLIIRIFPISEFGGV